MPVEIKLPKIGLTMTEALILEWQKKEGDHVKKGDILFVFETEKVTYEVEAPEDGVLAKILVPEKETVPVGTLVAYLLRAGESISDLEPLLVRAERPPIPAKEVERPPIISVEAVAGEQAGIMPGARIKASPLAKKTARIRKIALEGITGTGPGGMIIQEDVEKMYEIRSKEPPVVSLEAEGVSIHKILPLTGMRRTIAKKMLASKNETAQTYMTNSVDAGKILEYRQKVLSHIEKEVGVRATITDILMKITAAAIREHPIINTRWTDKGIVFFEDIHMGMAMALDDGLIVAVIRDITRKGLPQVAKERQELVQKGRNHSFLPDDISGSTFTLSGLGMFGVEQFTANINLPENAILAVGAITDKPVAINGEAVIRPIMNITLSYDHRTIDGAEAAKFMRTLKAFIEDPVPVLEGPRVTVVTEKKRVTVIGGGVGGYPAAISASRLGAQVTLIEKDQVGGICLNWGCIPTKSLLQSCQVIKTIEDAGVFGVTCGGHGFDFKKIMERKNSVVTQLRNGVEKLLEARKVRVIKGTAALVDPSSVKIMETEEEIQSDSVIIATGSTPRRLDIEGADGPHIWDSNDFLKMEKLPKSVAIIGGGFIGVEFAQILKRLKVDVTILEVLDNLVPGLDKEIALALQKSIVDEGIKVFASARVEKIAYSRGKNSVSFLWGGKTHKLAAEKVIYSVGRKPDLSWLDLDRTGLAQAKGALVVNERMETNIPGIYAVGDVVGGVMLAHVAIAEGECAGRNAMGRQGTVSYRAIPSCIYTSPEVASVGLSEEEARKGFDIEVGRFSFHGCGKALILNQTYGMVKIVSERRSRTVLGVHIIGPHATDMIAEAVLGMSMEMTVDQLARGVHPHPTLSDALMESAMSLCGGAIHMP